MSKIENRQGDIVEVLPVKNGNIWLSLEGALITSKASAFLTPEEAGQLAEMLQRAIVEAVSAKYLEPKP